jgi:hypothetical protein
MAGKRYKSAAEVLADLLPALAEVAKSSRGRGKIETWKSVYLETARHCANVTISARVAGVSRETVRKTRNEDAEFAAAEKDAMDEGVDLVEASAFKSAVYGDMETVYHQGIPCGEVLKYSDAMRALLLKGRKPEVYRDKLEHAGNVAHTHLTLAEMEAREKQAQQWEAKP